MLLHLRALPRVRRTGTQRRGVIVSSAVFGWRVCDWKNTDPDWDATLKIVIAFAREGQRLAAQPNVRPAFRLVI